MNIELDIPPLQDFPMDMVQAIAIQIANQQPPEDLGTDNLLNRLRNNGDIARASLSPEEHVIASRPRKVQCGPSSPTRCPEVLAPRKSPRKSTHRAEDFVKPFFKTPTPKKTPVKQVTPTKPMSEERRQFRKRLSLNLDPPIPPSLKKQMKKKK